jgi:hypothetical protein
MCSWEILIHITISWRESLCEYYLGSAESGGTVCAWCLARSCIQAESGSDWGSSGAPPPPSPRPAGDVMPPRTPSLTHSPSSGGGGGGGV